MTSNILSELPLPLPMAIELAIRCYDECTVRVGGVEALVVDVGVQCVAIRGTEAEPNDVLRDIRLFPWRDKRVGWSHAGFLKGARGLVDKGLFGLLRREQSIVLIGHSKGGAEAVNAAALLYSEGFNVVGVITFGAPRTFFKSTVKRWEDVIPMWQYSNPGDPVPNVPLRFGYRHVNEISTERKADGINNHSMKYYTEALQ